MTNLKVMICTMFGVVGGLFARLFGGWTEDMITLVIFMAVDFAMGLIVAGYSTKATSQQVAILAAVQGGQVFAKSVLRCFLC